MKNTIVAGAIVVLALLITACGSAAPALTGVPTEVQPLATAVVGSAQPLETAIVGTAQPLATDVVGTATGLAASTPEAAATSSTGTTSAPPVITTQTTSTSEASVPVTGETTIKATLSDNYGPILVDADGVAVYIYSKDTQNGTTSACTEQQCTSEWTPVTTQGAPIAGAGAIQKLLGTITRPDGTMQVTYNGWPLYYSNKDNGSGSTNGQGLENSWYLVSPAGKAIQK
jgi:predicted lipoprotein with Yx(FWY)xxD motif